MSAYTIERLKRVVDVFVTADQPEGREPTLEDLFGCPSIYDLRPRMRDRNWAHTVPCLDDDDTDDYEPSEDLSPRKRKSASNTTSLGSSRAPKKAKAAPKVFATLQRELLGVAAIQSQIPGILGGYNLRPRPQPLVPSSRAMDNTAKSAHPSSSPTSLPNNCLACLELGLECSVEEHPFSYPCDNCRDDNIECVLDPPPTWKRPCDQCKRRHRSLQCSYSNYDYDHSKSCQSCHDRGFDCLAGPANGPPSMFHMNSRDTEEPLSLHGTTSSYKTQVIDSSSFSSSVDIYERTDIPPAYQLATASKPAAINLSPEFDFMNKPMPRVVRTELPHPLKVNHDSSPEDEQKCHFCSNFAYGISGLGIRYPEVIEASIGKWIELRGGHTHEGKEPSRMCVQCTFKRVGILLCSHGSIVPLEGSNNVDVDIAYFELDKASMALHPEFKEINTEDDFKATLQTWCSLCRAPAFWRCDDCHPVGKEGTSSTIPSDPGCGLHLCDYCAFHATQLHGDLDAVVAERSKDPQNEVDFRADVEYILRNSENNVLWQQLYGNV